MKKLSNFLRAKRFSPAFLDESWKGKVIKEHVAIRRLAGKHFPPFSLFN